jgi:diguanylate cyclase (GGDEF)-like protein
MDPSQLSPDLGVPASASTTPTAIPTATVAGFAIEPNQAVETGNDADAAVVERQYGPRLYRFIGLEIVLGLIALVWASVAYPLWPSISLTQAGGREGILLGLLFWILLGLLGGMRVESLHGHGVLTFHMPFIIAATALGGPVAGGWVAMISTLEARELRSSEVPWYGTLANHCSVAAAAVVAGVVYDQVQHASFARVTDQPQAATLVAIVLSTAVLSLGSTGLATLTTMLRDELTWREATRVLDTSFRQTSAFEVLLGWILFIAYSTIGWWAALICSSFVLVIWQAHEAREIARHDALTGLLSRGGFDVRLEEVLVGVRRGAGRVALLGIDLDKFKRVNDKHGHDAGDDVLREVGVRLRGSIRLTDAAVRRGGDEFGVLLAGVSDAAAAEAIARKIHAELCRPIQTSGAVVTIGASIGVLMIEPGDRIDSIDKLHARVDREMYAIKKDGGGVRVRPRTAT